MMKDYLVYRLMGNFGVASPLCSYVYITVNGEDWGLYLAVEGVEDTFLERNYGKEAGELYKAFGKAMDKLPDTWRVYVLSSHPDFERCYGRFADKKRKLYNGMLKCDLFMYGKRL